MIFVVADRSIGGGGLSYSGNALVPSTVAVRRARSVLGWWPLAIAGIPSQYLIQPHSQFSPAIHLVKALADREPVHRQCGRKLATLARSKREGYPMQRTSLSMWNFSFLRESYCTLY